MRRNNPYLTWWNNLDKENQNKLCHIANQKNQHCGNSYKLAELMELPKDKALWVYKLITP